MNNALLLFLSANQLLAQQLAGGKIAAQRQFENSQEEQNEFAAFVKDYRHPTYLLVDLIEEDFRQEAIPHLIGGSRSALLQRKFEQFYRNTPFRQATLLQRQKTGRRDDDMLFSALTNPALVTPWLNILLAQKIPLAGIYSVPQISAPLVEDHPSEYLLLISWEKSAGLRQTYFSGHRLQISRLTPLNTDLAFQDAVMMELPRTYQYLKSLSLLPAGQTLDVRLLGHAPDLVELQSALPENTDMRYDFVDLDRLAGQLDIDAPASDSDASQIFLHHLATNPPQSHYANADHVHYHTLWRLRHALNLIAGALLAGSLAWGMADIWQGGWNASDIHSMDAETQRLRVEAAQIADDFPNSRVPASDMKTAVSIMRELKRQALSPPEILRPVSLALDRHPQIGIDEVAWGMDVSLPGANAAQDSPPTNHSLTIKGHLLGFAGDYRGALTYLERFGLDLERQGYDVTPLSRPLDTSPGGSITDSLDAKTEALSFSLKLARRAQE